MSRAQWNQAEREEADEQYQLQTHANVAREALKFPLSMNCLSNNVEVRRKMRIVTGQQKNKQKNVKSRISSCTTLCTLRSFG